MTLNRKVFSVAWAAIPILLAILAPLAAYYFRHYLPFFGVLFIGTFVALVASAFGVMRRHAVLLANGAAILLALGIGEFYLGRGTANVTVETGPSHFVTDEDLGYAPAFNGLFPVTKITNGVEIYSVTYSFNNGIRDTPQANSPARPTVLFFGCSRTFGEGVNDTETLPAQFARFTHRPSYNFGFRGYGPHQFLRALEKSRLEKLSLQVPQGAVFIYTLVTSHVDRAAGRSSWDENGPQYTLDGTEVRYDGPFSQHRSLLDRLISHSYIAKRILYRLSLSEDDDRERVIRILAKAAKLIETTYGARLIIVFWDVSPTWTERDLERREWLAKHLATLDQPIIALSEVAPELESASYYIPQDGHPTAEAYARVATHISEVLGD